MRRLRTQKPPYISILSIGVEEARSAEPVLMLSCGRLNTEIRCRFESLDLIRLTSLKNEFRIDAFDKNDNELGPLLRQDLAFANEIHSILRKELLSSSEILVRIFSIFRTSEYETKSIRGSVVVPINIAIAA